MTKRIILALVCIGFSINTFAQNPKKGERIKALKIAFITERLDLSPSEAQKFWPIYNAIQDQKDALRQETRQARQNLNFETLTDNQAQKLIQNMIRFENKKHELQTKQINELLLVLPAKKVIQLKLVEDQFNKRMLQEIRKRRNMPKRKKP